MNWPGSTPGSGPLTPILVRGHGGLPTVNAITWREHGLSVLFPVYSVSSPPARVVLSTRQLIAIADSAP
jgi:hypothetical protein